MFPRNGETNNGHVCFQIIFNTSFTPLALAKFDPIDSSDISLIGKSFNEKFR